MRRLVLAAVLAAGVAACSHKDPSLADLSQKLLDATPPDQRAAIQPDLDRLQALADGEKIGSAERQALLDLYGSAERDGKIDDDERLLLGRLVHDIVAGTGHVAVQK